MPSGRSDPVGALRRGAGAGANPPGPRWPPDPSPPGHGVSPRSTTPSRAAPPSPEASLLTAWAAAPRPAREDRVPESRAGGGGAGEGGEGAAMASAANGSSSFLETPPPLPHPGEPGAPICACASLFPPGARGLALAGPGGLPAGRAPDASVGLRTRHGPPRAQSRPALPRGFSPAHFGLPLI